MSKRPRTPGIGGLSFQLVKKELRGDETLTGAVEQAPGKLWAPKTNGRLEDSLTCAYCKAYPCNCLR